MFLNWDKFIHLCLSQVVAIGSKCAYFDYLNRICRKFHEIAGVRLRGWYYEKIFYDRSTNSAAFWEYSEWLSNPTSLLYNSNN